MNEDYFNNLIPNLTGYKHIPDDQKSQLYFEFMEKANMAAYSRTYYSDSYFNRTRGDEVATTVLEAYASGVPFENLLKKNKPIRAYWSQIQAEKIAELQRVEKEKERLQKLAEKRAARLAQRKEVMSKLTEEELIAFGLIKKGKAS